MALYLPLFQALNESGARYVVVGGVATVLHGYSRLTADVDLIVDLDPPAVANALQALEKLGLRPRLPVLAKDFADPIKREQWIQEKHMEVFSLFDPQNPLFSVDIFVRHPISFETLYAGSKSVDIGGATIRICSIDHLIELKRRAGRPQDLDDIAQLQRIQQWQTDETDKK
jgi:predicted nucleotidyltransferase